VGVENTFAAKVRLEKELSATKDQSLTEELECAERERLSAFDHMEEVERKAKVQDAELESCRSALTQERKKVEPFSQSLKGKQTTLDEAEAVRLTGMVSGGLWRRRLVKWSKRPSRS
ncbi:hypothetical protein PIB30_087841, partial [Stylosanthes scabra]|nr:hypothetical protein [Stylosanthes scabra]